MQGPQGVFPTRITDANGNYITITYLNNTGPKIQTVTDTMGRSVAYRIDPTGLGLLSALKRLFKRVINALIAAAVAFVFAFVVSAGNWGLAFAVAGPLLWPFYLRVPNLALLFELPLRHSLLGSGDHLYM